MPREIHRRDETHAEILNALRGAGYMCVPTANCGGFLGDIVVAAEEMNLVLEVKPVKWRGPRNERERAQETRRIAWRSMGGQVEVVRNVAEALQFVRFGLGTGLE